MATKTVKKKTKCDMDAATPKMAYYDSKFIESDAGRTIRILSEFFEPQQIFEDEEIKNAIVFFGSARTLPPAEIKKLRKNCKAGPSNRPPRPAPSDGCARPGRTCS